MRGGGRASTGVGLFSRSLGHEQLAIKKAAAGKAKDAGTPLTGSKRPADRDPGKMGVAQINKMLRQMQEGTSTSSS